MKPLSDVVDDLRDRGYPDGHELISDALRELVEVVHQSSKLRVLWCDQSRDLVAVDVCPLGGRHYEIALLREVRTHGRP